MDVLLIYPFAATSGIEEGIKVPPMGLAYLAAMLEKEGYSVEILDMNAQPDTAKHFASILEKKQPRIVGITCLTPFYSTVLSLAATVKRVLGVPVIVGGAHATALPEELLQQNTIDFIAIGEAEATIVDIADSLLRNGNKPEDIAGIALIKDNKFLVTKARGYIQNLDELPFPARHLFKHENYYSPQYKSTGVTSILTSRGCPYSCIFCDYQFLMGKIFRRRSPQNVIAEIEDVVKNYDVHHISFRDSTFTFDDK